MTQAGARREIGMARTDGAHAPEADGHEDRGLASELGAGKRSALIASELRGMTFAQGEQRLAPAGAMPVQMEPDPTAPAGQAAGAPSPGAVAEALAQELRGDLPRGWTATVDNRKVQIFNPSGNRVADVMPASRLIRSAFAGFVEWRMRAPASDPDQCALRPILRAHRIDGAGLAPEERAAPSAADAQALAGRLSAQAPRGVTFVVNGAVVDILAGGRHVKIASLTGKAGPPPVAPDWHYGGGVWTFDAGRTFVPQEEYDSPALTALLRAQGVKHI